MTTTVAASVPEAPSLSRTPLHSWHASHGGRLVEFGGWEMPVQYSSIIDEHHAVRRRVGLFDIGHMGRLRFEGQDVLPWIESLTTNTVARLIPGAIQYSLMLSPEAGILDDILVYRMPSGDYEIVCNASNRQRVVEQFLSHPAAGEARLLDHTLATGMIAIQGPQAIDVVTAWLGGEEAGRILELAYYHVASTRDRDGRTLNISRTGYTGEDGFEVVVYSQECLSVWTSLIQLGEPFGIQPCGLGARDTLRLEAAMPLHGHEISEQIDPYTGGVGWAVKLEKGGGFVGRDAALAAKQRFTAGTGSRRVGLALQGKRIARQGSRVLLDGRQVGTVTSGTFSPTLEISLAMALVESSSATVDTPLIVDVRGKEEPATVVKLPFYSRPRR